MAHGCQHGFVTLSMKGEREGVGDGLRVARRRRQASGICERRVQVRVACSREAIVGMTCMV
jgi:hypothetical protein